MALPKQPAQKAASTEVSLAEAVKSSNGSVAELERKKMTLAQQYKAEKQVAVTGSPFYRPYFGNTMPIVINGISIYVPMNGQQYEIPESFACVFYERIQRVDAQRNAQERMSDVTKNEEAFAGEKELIRPV